MSDGSTIRLSEEDLEQQNLTTKLNNTNQLQSSIITDHVAESTLINLSRKLTNSEVLPPIAKSIDSNRESLIRQKKQMLKKSLQKQ